MPDIDGWETCRQIRLLSNVPVIMLTTMDKDQDVLRGFDYGADDFVTKPFSRDVLLARARAVLRRVELLSEGDDHSIYNDEYLNIDLHKRRVLVNGEQIQLTATEFRLLSYLMKNAGQILTYQNILDKVWGWEYQDSIDYVHVYISHLRRKLEADPRSPHYVITERGIGYRFERQS